MNRRAFFQTSGAAATCALAGVPSLQAAEHQLGRIGLQLYTVRDLAERDFAGTLSQIAAVGYQEVEIATLHNHSPKEVRAMLDHASLSAPSGHVSYQELQRDLPATLDTAQILGMKFIVCSWIDEKQRQEPDGWKRAADLFNRAGEATHKAGLQFAYHQYTFEFELSPTIGGKRPYDFLLENTDPRLVQFEMDLCWATIAGADLVKYFAKYPGRFPLVHLKDWSGHEGTLGDEKKYMTSVGSGSINWKGILAHSHQAGIRHYFVENDVPQAPIADIRASYTYLRNLRF